MNRPRESTRPTPRRVRRPPSSGIGDRAALAEALKARALAEGFGMAGICALTPSEHFPHMVDWIARGYHGEMAYLARSDALDRRADPGRIDSRCADSSGADPEPDDLGSPPAGRGEARLRSALVVADFYPAAEDEPPPADRGIIARYARGRDYHRVVQSKLRRVLRWLEGELGAALSRARASVDTSPVLERELARRAGLGWFGRNTMVIHPRRGSYFFLGTLLLEFDLPADEPFEADHCGTCNACVEACPTGALLGRDANGAPIMDARRCISYLTIEHRGGIPLELRPLLGNRIFGCDICQEACPFTRRFAETAIEPDYTARVGTEAPSLVSLLQMTREQWEEFSRGSAIRRAGYEGFQRNVAVAVGNWLADVEHPSAEVIDALRRLADETHGLVAEHAAWALRQLPARG